MNPLRALSDMIRFDSWSRLLQSWPTHKDRLGIRRPKD